MSWLAAIAASTWARIAAAGAIVGAVLLLLARVFRAGRQAEAGRNAESALRHQSETAQETSRSDEAVADPRSARARRIRKRFERPD